MVHCLTHAQCDEMIHAAESLNFTRATVLGEDCTVEDEIRSNTSSILPAGLDKLAHAAINQAILRWGDVIKNDYPDIVASSQLPGLTPGLETYKETISFLKYDQTQKYDWHVDQSVHNAGPQWVQSDTRLVSVVVYLNDDFEGGETEMPEKIWKPKKGKALIFPSHWTYPHQARQVTKGTKYALVTWFHPQDHSMSRT